MEFAQREHLERLDESSHISATGERPGPDPVLVRRATVESLVDQIDTALSDLLNLLDDESAEWSKLDDLLTEWRRIVKPMVKGEAA